MATQISTVSENQNREGGYGADTHKHTDIRATNEGTLEKVMLHQNRADISLADGFERANYEVEVPEKEKVTIDEVMLHQNRALHNEDGFEPDDYRK